MKWMVTGPRNLDSNLAKRAQVWMKRLPLLDPNEITVINGYADGLDKLVDRLTDELGYTKIRIPVSRDEWKRFGKSAGHRRNSQMVEEADTVVGFWNGTSRGTRNAIEQALKAKKLAIVYFSNGVHWMADNHWSPIAYGVHMSIYNRADIAWLMAERIRMNADAPKLREDPKRHHFADNRALDAAQWLMDGNIVEYQEDGQYAGWMRFRSKSRKAVFHFTNGSECTCEGWSIQKQPCIHMFIAWYEKRRIQKIERDIEPMYEDGDTARMRDIKQAAVDACQSVQNEIEAGATFANIPLAIASRMALAWLDIERNRHGNT